MTSSSLTFGSALLAFSPSLSLLFFLIFPKPQLLILAICAAFAYLLSALFSSACWWLCTLIPGTDAGWGALLTVALPGVLCQFAVRCGFCNMYFRVEDVIQKSVAKHEAEARQAVGNSGGGDVHAETNALQLQLNDLACSLAAGGGYAFLHSLFLYGTLLASESGQNYHSGVERDGTLYQPSCSMPSLIHGALISGMFGILDVVWMCCTFYGMRRRSLYGTGSFTRSMKEGLGFWKGLSDSSYGGNASLGLVVISHLAASLALAPNMHHEGCKVSLPLLGGIAVLVGILFVKGVNGHFLPEHQRRRIMGLRTDGDNVTNEHHVD